MVTASSALLPAIPHLYKLANYPVVIHASLHPLGQPEYADITAIRQSGFTFLHSETIQEAQDIALTAHSLAIRSGKGVIHFFDSSNSSKDNPIAAEQYSISKGFVSLKHDGQEKAVSAADGLLYVDDGHRATTLRDKTQMRVAQSRDNVNGSDTVELPQEHGSATSTTGSSARDSSADSRPTISSVSTAESVRRRTISSEDIVDILYNIWEKLEESTQRSYRPFEYTGPDDAEHAIFIFGSTGMFVDELSSQSLPAELGRIGLITARLYRPWIGSLFSEAIPKSIKRIAVLEQIKRKTTKWGPVLLDVLTSLHAGDQRTGSMLVVGYQLGYLEPVTIRQALRGVIQNLQSPTPVQNLEVGVEAQTLQIKTSLQKPEVETAYTKVLEQLFGSRLYVANQHGSSNTGISAKLATSPEFGFGSLLARIDRKKKFIGEVQTAVKSGSFITDAPRVWLSKWVLAASDEEKSSAVAQDVVDRLKNDGSQLAGNLLDNKLLFSKESRWLIGSDAWSYDLGNSGVHHVIASGANINMLIIDSTPYSTQAAADSMRRKKDIGLYAMNFGNAYVASVAIYGSYTQVLEAMIEADKFNGPSVVVAYLPYNKEDDSPLIVLQETKRAIDLGYWPLYRWNPDNEEKHGTTNFNLDSERIRQELEEFLSRENKLSQLVKRYPELASNLSGSFGTEVRAVQKRQAKEAYNQMLEGLYGAPITILFASDNSNAANLAKRLANRSKARGLKSMVMPMDDYPIVDLPTEENLVLITSTAGQGEFPQNGRAFWEALKTGNDLDLANVHYSVFALGDSHYWPRKEDKIYYNKPGKDLDARVALLGGRKLADIGLGDDQDPDAYQTGYAEWEPKLWQALGVDKVEGLPEEPPPLTNEDIKIDSNYLRGTIAEGLFDTSTGAIAAADQQLTKFHGTYQEDDRDLRDERKAQGLEPAYIFMIRCRLDGGVATPEQWLRMDAISDDFGNHTMKLTTRQTFQFHGVVKGKLKPAMRAINKALMTTLAACGDVNRNVMCSVMPTQSAYHKDVHQIAEKISEHLLPSTTAYHEIWIKDENDKKTQIAGNAVVDHEPLYGPTYLPRKFKISIAVPPNNDTDVYAHDVGLIAIKNDKGRLAGFNVLVGGGMGVTHNNKKTYPRTGSILGYISAEYTHIVCEKIMLVQRDHGDRTNRKHARLKYTIDDMGVEVFTGKVEELLSFKFEASRPFEFVSNIDTFGWQRDETGLNHFTMFIENGRIEDTPDFPMKTGLKEIAKVHKGEFRLSPNQHLVLSNVADENLDNVKAMLKKHKLDNLQFSGLRLSSSACVAFPTCALAMAESERYLPQLISKLEQCLEENGLRHDSIVMRMTGCPNGCARPWVAEVAFVGKAYGAYNMYLGGGYHGQRLNKLYRSSIKEEEILDILKSMFRRYATERHEGERFGDFTIRVGLIKETTEGKAFHDLVEEEEEAEEVA